MEQIRSLQFSGRAEGNGDGDAAEPNSLIFDTSGNLYGFGGDGGSCSTEFGSTSCYGAAFELRKHSGAWREKVIYRADASTEIPSGATFDAHGNLYGSSPLAGFDGVGSVFRLTPPPGKGLWAAQVLYTFQNQSDGAFPSAGFVFDAKGNLYGSTSGSDSVAGNVFELTPSGGGDWTESVLVDFWNDGIVVFPPQGPIMDAEGNLYGATDEGGADAKGFVYKAARKKGVWAEKTLHDFTGGADGNRSLAGLLVGKDGALYGTTSEGGAGSCPDGCGTVFRITR